MENKEKKTKKIKGEDNGVFYFFPVPVKNVTGIIGSTHYRGQPISVELLKEKWRLKVIVEILKKFPKDYIKTTEDNDGIKHYNYIMGRNDALQEVKNLIKKISDEQQR